MSLSGSFRTTLCRLLEDDAKWMDKQGQLPELSDSERKELIPELRLVILDRARRESYFAELKQAAEIEKRCPLWRTVGAYAEEEGSRITRYGLEVLDNKELVDLILSRGKIQDLADQVSEAVTLDASWVEAVNGLGE